MGAIKKNISLLGYQAKDKVTGFEGMISSICFDAYGCIQVALTPKVTAEGKCEDSKWLDVSRIEKTGDKRLIEIPNYDKGYIADGKKGPMLERERPKI